jgi:hypothetical protein
MAVITLPGAPFPTITRTAGVGVTLQEYTLPRDARQVTVKADAAAWVQFTGSDGDATTATAKSVCAANGSLTFGLGAAPSLRATKILVAADSGTANVEVIVEGAL